jgi:hypothetical protein
MHTQHIIHTRIYSCWLLSGVSFLCIHPLTYLFAQNCLLAVNMFLYAHTHAHACMHVSNQVCCTGGEEVKKDGAESSDSDDEEVCFW